MVLQEGRGTASVRWQRFAGGIRQQQIASAALLRRMQLLPLRPRAVWPLGGLSS